VSTLKSWPWICLCLGVWGGSAPQGLVELPRPDLSSMLTPVADSILRMLAQIESLSGKPTTPPRELAEAYGSYGLLCHAMELEETALAAYRNARQLDPSDSRWPYYAGFLYQHAGLIAEARESFRAVLKIEPVNPYALVRLGNAQVLSSQFEAALETFQQALSLDPNSASIFFGLGQAEAGRNQPQQAIGHFRKALELQPQATAIHYPLAIAYRKTGDMKSARAHLDQLGKGKIELADPHLKDLADMVMGAAIQVVLAMAAQPAGFSIASYETFALAELSKRPGVAEYLDQVAKYKEGQTGRNNVEISRIRYAIGILRNKQGAIDQAMVQFRLALELFPDFPEPYVGLANVLITKGRFQQAQTLMDTLIARVPAHAGARYARATAHLNQGQNPHYLLAIADLKEAVGLAPDNAAYRRRLARAYALMGSYAEAITQYEQMVALDLAGPEKAGVHETIGNLYLKRGDPASAICHWQSSVNLEPRNTTRRLALAKLLGAQERYSEAALQLSEVTRLEPQNTLARNQEIRTLIMASDFARAKASLERGLQIQAGNSHWQLALARVLSAAPDTRVRDPQRALKLARAAQQDHPSPQASITLAMALAATGAYEEASTHLQAAIAQCNSHNHQAHCSRMQADLARYKQGQPCCADNTVDTFLPLP